MRGLLPGGVLIALLTVASAQQPVMAPPLVPAQRSISASGQFVIYYQDKTIRARLARKLEDIKEHWLKRLSLTDEWKGPVVVRLLSVRPPGMPRIATSLFESDAGELKIQVDIYEPTVLQSGDFDIEVYRALCLEYGYRNAPPKAGKAFFQPPAWLLEGLYEDNKSREDGLAAGLYTTLIDRGSLPKIETFLKQRPATFDATSRAVYRAQALGLLRGLIALPGGSGNLANYLRQLPTTDPVDAKELINAFPALEGDPSRLVKMWILSMAGASASDRLAAMSIEESRRELLKILDITAPPDPKNPKAPPLHGPEAMQEIARSEEGRYILGQKTEELLRLQMRVHPLMRPIVEEYRLTANLLMAKPKKKVKDRLAKNGELLKAVTEQGMKVSDYMNWYEAAQLQTPSSDFTSINTENILLPSQRKDAISRKLDAIEVRGW